jgi:Leucine-rich repeat (LRR) protein
LLGSPEGNQIEDISALASLENLADIKLWNNKISDISPLENLPGLKTLWILKGNPLSDESLIIVDNLKNRGVEVQ